MTRFDPKAIITAMLLSLVLDVVGSVVLVALFSDGSVRGDLAPAQLEEAILAVTQGTGFLMASFVYGTATTVFGGYVAARMARAFPYFNALAVGVVGLVLGLLLGSNTPLWFSALAYLVTLPAALYGGHLAPRRNQ